MLVLVTIHNKCFSEVKETKKSIILVGYNPQFSELDAGTNQCCILDDVLIWQ